VAPDGKVDASIASAYQDESQAVHKQQADEVHLVAQVAIFHWQANAENRTALTS
jgi:hypothetical protein